MIMPLPPTLAEFKEEITNCSIRELYFYIEIMEPDENLTKVSEYIYEAYREIERREMLLPKPKMSKLSWKQHGF